MHDLILRSVNGWIWIPLSDREGYGEHQQSQDVEQALQAPEVQTQLHLLSSVELMSHQLLFQHQQNDGEWLCNVL